MSSNRLRLPLVQAATIRGRVILKGKAWAIQIVRVLSQRIKLIRITIRRIRRTQGPKKLLVLVRALLAVREIKEKVILTTTQWTLIKLMNLKITLHQQFIMGKMVKLRMLALTTKWEIQQTKRVSPTMQA
jgi:hypothetical protein